MHSDGFGIGIPVPFREILCRCIASPFWLSPNVLSECNLAWGDEEPRRAHDRLHEAGGGQVHQLGAHEIGGTHHLVAVDLFAPCCWSCLQRRW